MTEIRLKMEYNHEVGEWVTIWSRENRDALQGSDQVVGTELMGKGTFEITFDNDNLECWLTLTMESQIKCPNCGNDNLEPVGDERFFCRECREYCNREDAGAISDADEMKDKIKCPRCKSENTKSKERSYTDEEEMPDTVVEHHRCNNCKYTWDVVK